MGSRASCGRSRRRGGRRIGGGAINLVADFLAGAKSSAVAGEAASALYVGAVYGLVIGAIPAVAALTLTPAKRHPWRSLPILVLAAVAGLAIVVFVDVATGNGLFENVFAAIALFAVPAVAAFVTAWNIERFPLRFRFGR